MLIGMRNVKAIYLRLVKTKILESFAVRRICQCVLENLFGRCRSHSALGSNTNPTVTQFKSFIPKLFVNNEITSSVFANCSDQLDILYLSSRIPTSNAKGIVHQSPHEREPELHQFLQEDEDEMNSVTTPISSNQEIGIAYVAGQIELKLEKLCSQYSIVFSENDEVIIDSFPVTKESRIPCRSTFDICTLTHRILEPQLLKTDFNYTQIMADVVAQINCNTIFPKSVFNSNMEFDKSGLIESIADNYISLRAIFIAKKATFDNQMKTAEKKKARVIKHFQGR